MPAGEVFRSKCYETVNSSKHLPRLLPDTDGYYLYIFAIDTE